MPERKVTKVRYGEDYYPFKGLTKLNFPGNDYLPDFPSLETPLFPNEVAARADFDIAGHEGYIVLQPITPQEGQATPLGEARLVHAVRRGKTRIIESPVRLAICSLVESNRDYRVMLRTEAKFTLGSAIYRVDLVDNELFEPDEDNEVLELLSYKFRDVRGGRARSSLVLPGRPEPLAGIKVNFFLRRVAIQSSQEVASPQA